MDIGLNVYYYSFTGESTTIKRHFSGHQDEHGELDYDEIDDVVESLATTRVEDDEEGIEEGEEKEDGEEGDEREEGEHQEAEIKLLKVCR